NHILPALALTGPGSRRRAGAVARNARTAVFAGRTRATGARSAGSGGLLVERLADFRPSGVEFLQRPLNRRRVVTLAGLADTADEAFDLPAVLARNALAEVLQLLLSVVRDALGLVLQVDELAPLLIVFLVALGLAGHPLDLFLRQAAGALDLDA